MTNLSLVFGLFKTALLWCLLFGGIFPQNIAAQITSETDSLPVVGLEYAIKGKGAFLYHLLWVFSEQPPDRIVDGRSLTNGDSIALADLPELLTSEHAPNYGFLETAFFADSSLAGVPLTITHFNVQPIILWLNGKKIFQSGTPSPHPEEEELSRIASPPSVGVTLREGRNTMLIAFSSHQNVPYIFENNLSVRGLDLTFTQSAESSIRRGRALVFGGTLLLLTLLLIVHVFLAYKSIHSYHIYVALCTFFTLMHAITTLSDSYFDLTFEYVHFMNVSFPLSYVLSFTFYLLAIRSILQVKRHLKFILPTAGLFGIVALYFFHTEIPTALSVLGIATILFLVAAVYSLVEAKRRDAEVRIGMLVGGLLMTCFGAVSYTLVYVVFGVDVLFLFYVSVLLSYTGIPVSLTLVVVQSYSDLFFSLEQKIRERTLELEDSLRFKTDFLGNISHEFITPLTISKNVLHLAKSRYTLETDLKSDFGIIDENLDRLHEMVKQLLELTQSDQKSLTLREDEFEAVAFYRNVIDSFKPLVDQKSLFLHTRYPEQECLVKADKARIRIILSNLISNAIKFSPSDGLIIIKIDIREKMLVFSIADSGPGIPEGLEETIFDRFYRINQLEAEYVEGAGIGLELSRTLARLHKGDVVAEANHSGGALFHFSIPVEKIISKQQTRVPSTTNEVQPSKSCLSKSSQKHSLLVVDDNLAMQQTVAEILSDIGEIHVASNGKEALELMQNLTPDLIVSDIMMPVMNGNEFVHHVQQHPDWEEIPIVMLTAKLVGEEKTELYKIGVIDYITKPFDPNHLTLKVRNLLRFYERRKKVILSSNLVELGEHENLATRIANFVSENVKNPNITVELLAEQFAQSRRNLFRIIEAETGMKPAEFVREIRLKRALELTQSKGNLRLDELAYAVGYKSPSGFRHAFEERFGYHPTKIG